MVITRAYHRPNTLDEALQLLADPDRVVLAGGTVLNDRTTPVPGTADGDRDRTVELVDLQALGLEGVQSGGDGRLTIGSTTTLQALADDERVPGLLRELARAELPNTLRNLATLGGTYVVNHPDSGLAAGLLVHDVEATTAGGGDELIVDLTVASDGTGAWAATGRTPADTPIVAAVARRDAAGAVRLALTGVAAEPVLVDPADPTAGLSPPGDFRGSAEYRLELAAVLSARALAEVG